MAIQQCRANEYFGRLLKQYSVEQLKQRLRPKHEAPAQNIPRDPRISEKTVARRWRILALDMSVQQQLLDSV